MAKLPLTISDSPVVIDKLVPGGQGIGTVKVSAGGSTADDNIARSMAAVVSAGKRGFFWNALPGETVTKYSVTKNKSHYFEAVALEIEDTNPHRIAPKDSCYLSTSPWQIMDYGYEPSQKAELLQETFAQVGLGQCFADHLRSTGSIRGEPARNDGPGDPCPQSIVQTDYQDYHYRNKMEYALYWNLKKSQIELAFHERGSHRKVPVKSSSIERPEIFKKALEIVADLNSRHEEARKYQSLLLRCSKNGEVSGGLYENKKPHPVFDNLEDEILGQKYSYSPNGFFQINLPVYELALKEIKSYIETNNVLDLYAGVGTIGLSVARDKNLTLVENNAAAYQELAANCARGDATAGPRTPRSVLAKSEEMLKLINGNQTVIVDPPRAGCDQKLLDRFLEIKPRRIIYLSCNPATQARDVKILSEKYQIIKVRPFNFFPRTPHLENLVVLDVI